MRSSRDMENKAIITLFILVILLFVGLFVGKNYIFNYINSNVSLNQTTSQLLSSATSKEFNIDKKEVVDLEIFSKEKFNDLEKNSFSLPRFGVGRKNPFQNLNQ